MASTTTARLRRQIVNERNGGANFLDKKKDMVRVQELRRRAEQLRSELVEQIDGQLNDLFDDVLQDVEDLETPNGHSFSPSRDKLNGTKVFVPRQSVLTELLEVNHIKTIYNIFVALLILFSFNTVVYDYIDKGSVQLDFSILSWAFGKTSTVISIWLVMKIMAISAFPLFFAWHANRHSWLRIPDAVWLILYITYQVIFAVFPVQEVCIHNLPPASSIIILLEQIRLMLKVHAFVRENAPKVLSIKPNPKTAVLVEGNQGSDGERTANTDTTNGEEQEHEQEHDVPQLPEFGQYLYFLFCPTLIYRDHYPMTPCIRWNYVVSNVFQVLMCIFYLYYVFARFCVPVFRNIGKEPWNYKNFTLSVFSCMLPGTMILVLGFFALLHSWLNAFAEMTRFADRMFYKDWWNSASYADYYRTWNVVVHDWLYAYIYKDCVKLIKNRQVATVLVFSMSAIVHEYVLMFAFRFCFPILLVMFGAIGLSFVFLKPKKSENVSQVWNVFMWITLIIGNGLLMCLYSQEWFAIQNCPRTSTSLLDQLVPRSWSVECLGKSLKLD